MRALILCCLVLVGCSKTPGDDCFDRVKGGLKDPETATMVEWDKVVVPGFTDVVRVTIRATNSYGAFGRIYGMCRKNDYQLTQDKYGYKDKDAWTIR